MPDPQNRASLPDRSSMEDALRHAVESGQGFYSAAETEQASRWALAEVDRLRAALEQAEKALTRAARHVGLLVQYDAVLPVVVCKARDGAREALNGGTDGR